MTYKMLGSIAISGFLAVAGADTLANTENEFNFSVKNGKAEFECVQPKTLTSDKGAWVENCVDKIEKIISGLKGSGCVTDKDIDDEVAGLRGFSKYEHLGLENVHDLRFKYTVKISKCGS